MNGARASARAQPMSTGATGAGRAAGTPRVRRNRHGISAEFQRGFGTVRAGGHIIDLIEKRATGRDRPVQTPEVRATTIHSLLHGPDSERPVRAPAVTAALTAVMLATAATVADARCTDLALVLAIDGSGSFRAMVVEGFASFGAAIDAKLAREISPDAIAQLHGSVISAPRVPAGADRPAD